MDVSELVGDNLEGGIQQWLGARRRPFRGIAIVPGQRPVLDGEALDFAEHHRLRVAVLGASSHQQPAALVCLFDDAIDSREVFVRFPRFGVPRGSERAHLLVAICPHALGLGALVHQLFLFWMAAAIGSSEASAAAPCCLFRSRAPKMPRTMPSARAIEPMRVLITTPSIARWGLLR